MGQEWIFEIESSSAGINPIGAAQADVIVGELATEVTDAAYSASWDGVGTDAPSQNAVYDKIEVVEDEVSKASVGLIVTIKDADNLYIEGGSVNIAGTICNVTSRLTIPISESLVDHLYYLYASVPSTGTTLAAEDIELSTAAPEYVISLGAYYKTGDSTSRYIGRYYQASASMTVTPAVTADDGFWNSDGTFRSNECIIGYYYTILYRTFFRFPNIIIPQGTTISSAILTLHAQRDDYFPITIDVYFNDSDNAVAPTNSTEGNALSLTSGIVWTSPRWYEGSAYSTPELKTILQTVINRVGWSSGNAIMVVIKGRSGDQIRVAHDISTNPSLRASLRIYTEALGVDLVSHPRILDVGYDADNVPNDKDLLAYDTSKGIYKHTDSPEVSEILLTPKDSSTGAEGTMFYNSTDDHVYVGTEA